MRQNKQRGILMMKALFITVFAVTSINAANLDQLLEKNGKSGTLMSYYNGKVFEAESNLNCAIRIEDNFLTIEAPTYFGIVAMLDDAKVQQKNNKLIITTTENGKRPGGSVCGDMGILSGYKKIVEVTNDSVTVIQDYRCNFIEKNNIKEVCTLK